MHLKEIARFQNIGKHEFIARQTCNFLLGFLSWIWIEGCRVGSRGDVRP